MLLTFESFKTKCSRVSLRHNVSDGLVEGDLDADGHQVGRVAEGRGGDGQDLLAVVQDLDAFPKGQLHIDLPGVRGVP